MRYNKYKVAPKKDRTVDGIVFASKLEMQMYLDLKLLERAGNIAKLQLQPKYVVFNGFIDASMHSHEPVVYVADFLFYDKRYGRYRVLDAKGKKTPKFKIKEKLFNKKFKDEGLYIEYQI